MGRFAVERRSVRTRQLNTLSFLKAHNVQPLTAHVVGFFVVRREGETMSAPSLVNHADLGEEQLHLASAMVWVKNRGRLLIAEASGTHYPVSQMEVHERTFTQVTGDGASATYVATVVIPLGYTVHDVLVGSTVVWDPSGVCTLTVGDADSSTGYINAKNLKSGGDFPANTSGGVSSRASLLGGTYAKGKYYAAAGLVTITVNADDSGGAGAHSAGRSRVLVLMSPRAKVVVAATHTA